MLPLHNSAPASVYHIVKIIIAGAEGRTRTDTRVAPQQFLRLPRLPFRHFGQDESRSSPALQYGAEAQNRTGDTRIFSPLLYQLSYLGAMNKIISITHNKINRLLLPTDQLILYVLSMFKGINMAVAYWYFSNNS